MGNRNHNQIRMSLTTASLNASLAGAPIAANVDLAGTQTAMTDAPGDGVSDTNLGSRPTSQVGCNLLARP
jgi:hypothetical protein